MQSMEAHRKIALVSPYDHAFHGGVADHINSLAAQFREWGHTVKIVAPCKSADAIDDDDFIPMGRAVPIPSGGSIARVSFSVWLKPQIKQMLEREAFDVVHFHEPFAGLISKDMLSLIDPMESTAIGTFHTYEGTRLYKIGAKHLAMPYFRMLQGRIAVSLPAHRFISRHFPGDYEIIPNGIQVDDFADAEPFEHLKSDGMINLLFLSRLEKRKGLKYLLGAFSRLKWEWPNLRLLVAGGGEPDADSLRILSERNLQDVVFLGRVSDEDKFRYYKTADIYCAPATGRESFGIVLLEAMAAGTPIVASGIEGYSSVITHGREGLLVPPKDEDALADALATLLKDATLRRRLATAGTMNVQEYRWERVARRVMDCYDASRDAWLDSVSRRAVGMEG